MGPGKSCAEKVTEGTFTFVAITEDGKPRALPDVRQEMSMSPTS